MRVVLDTNVLARAFVSAIGPADERQRLLLEPPHILVTSAAVLSELERILAYPRMMALHGRTIEQIDQAVTDLAATTEPVDLSNTDQSPIVRRDADDEWVVATALFGGASILCSRDRNFSRFSRLGQWTARNTWTSSAWAASLSGRSERADPLDGYDGRTS